MHLTLRVNQSTQHIALTCRGQGLEPRLEFARSDVAFGPILPHSQGDTQEVTVKNPCSFPIEMYSLEFDKVYLEEEMVSGRLWERTGERANADKRDMEAANLTLSWKRKRFIQNIKRGQEF